jgi:DNA polymerase zeta
MISAKKMQADNRQEPQYGERVPYLVVHRGLKDRLIDSVVSLEEFFSDK